MTTLAFLLFDHRVEALMVSLLSPAIEPLRLRMNTISVKFFLIRIPTKMCRGFVYDYIIGGIYFIWSLDMKHFGGR